MPSSFRRLWAFGCALFAVAACVSGRAGGGALLEPRFVAVHNLLGSLGLAQVGSIHEGVMSDGQEDRLALALPAGCFTIVVVGGLGLRDVAATLLDSRGRALAHDASGQSQAVVRSCLETGDTVALAIKAAGGGGSWVAEVWTGGLPEGGAATAGISPDHPVGTCASPLPLSPGTVSGSTAHGENNNAGSCGPSDSNELVYALTLAARTHATFDVEADFDSVLYVRKDDCAEPNSEVECNDDASDRKHSHIDTVLEAGKYFVFVDGYGHEGGEFKLTVALAEVQALTDRCRHAAPLVDGVAVSGTTLGTSDDARASCGGDGSGPDTVWLADLPTRARIRILEHSDDVVPVVRVRRVCTEPQSEVACADTGAGEGDAAITGVFDKGTYAVFVDAHERNAEGRYSVELETAPLAGSGVRGEACGDAPTLGPGPAGVVQGDTFNARDDLSGSCGGAGAADVVYRLEVAKRSLLVAGLESEEAKHLLVVGSRCGDPSKELACGRSVREVVAPGTYSLAVDGASPGAFGRFTLKWALHDLSGQSGACATAPTLVAGHTFSGTTASSEDRFVTPCGANDSGASGPDKVFRLVVDRRATVRLSLSAGFDAVIALRKACLDPTRGPAPELACESGTDVSRQTTLARTLEPGTYWVVVDGQAPDDRGPFTLDYRLEPLGG